MIKIAACDDNKDIAEGIKKRVMSHNFETQIEVDAFASGRELYEASLKKRYDILLLDIELDRNVSDTIDGSGMYLSNKMKEMYRDLLIIFFTGALGYERKLLNFEPFRFINKPIMDGTLYDAVGAAIKRILGWEEKYFRIQSSGIFINIRIDEIIYFSSRSPYITVHCIDDETDFREKMDKIEFEIKKMTDDFIRISKSHLVNRTHIKSYSSKFVQMTNGDTIAVSRKHSKDFFTHL